MGMLSCFSYGNLIFNFLNQNGIPFEDKMQESHSSTLMILANVGLVVMVYIDKIIIYFVTKQENKSQGIDIILMINIILAIVITVVAQLIKDEQFVPVYWFKLSYLLVIFILLLIIYKAETLKIKHISSDISSTENS